MKNLKLIIQSSKHRTAERLSAVTGIGESVLSKYVRGLRQPTAEHLRLLEEALGVRLRDGRNPVAIGRRDLGKRRLTRE